MTALRVILFEAEWPGGDGNRYLACNDNRTCAWESIGLVAARVLQDAADGFDATGLCLVPDLSVQSPDAGRRLGEALESGSSLKNALRGLRIAPEK
jgi:hypothetical protein